MARINIDEQFWRDVIKVAAKMGDVDKAIGQAVRFFDLAQQRYKHDRVISEDEFLMEKFDEAIIGVFAERVPLGIMAIGADKQFGWLKNRIKSGSKGGKISAEKRWGENAQESSDLPDSNNLAVSNLKANLSNCNPLPLTLPLTLSHPQNKIPDFNFESLFAEYPNKVGKGPGLERLAQQIKTQKDFENFFLAIANYKKYLQLEKNRDWLKPKQFDVFVGTGKKSKPWHDWINPDMSIFKADPPKVDYTAEAEFIYQLGRKHGFALDQAMIERLGETRVKLLRSIGGLQQVGQMPPNEFTIKALASKLKAASQTMGA